MNRNGWSEYLKKQRLQDLKSLAKQLGIYIKSNTKKNDCIDIILSNSPETLLSSNNFSYGLKDRFSINNETIQSEVSVPPATNKFPNLNVVEINEHFYSISGNDQYLGCSVCQKNISDNNLNCNSCHRQFHSQCVGFDTDKSEFNNNHMMVFVQSISKKENKHIKINSINFICPFCRFLVIDPYNKILKPLFFTTFYSYTAIHNIHPKFGNISFDNSSHLPHFTSKYTFSPTLLLNNNFESNGSESNNIMIYCLRLDKLDLNHEFPRILSIRANSRIIQNIESPSYDHIRRDCPLYLKDHLYTNQLITKPNVNITFSTLNALLRESENENLLSIPTAPYIIGLFLTKPISCDNMLDMILSENRLSTEISMAHFKSILENKIQSSSVNSQSHDDSSDEIICLNKDQYLNTLCPLTMDTIGLPGRGSFCNHINCFDIKAFIQINSTIKAFNTRWKCPLCYQVIRPSMLIVDSFVNMIVNDSTIPRENTKILINSGFFDKFAQNKNISGGFSVNNSSDIIKHESPGVNCSNSLMTEHVNRAENEIPQKSDSSFLNGANLSDTQNEIINISDDDDENVITDGNFAISEEELNLLLDNSKCAYISIRKDNPPEHCEEILVQNYVEDLDPLNSGKKRKVSETQLPNSLSERPTDSSNNSKTSISLRI